MYNQAMNETIGALIVRSALQIACALMFAGMAITLNTDSMTYLLTLGFIGAWVGVATFIGCAFCGFEDYWHSLKLYEWVAWNTPTIAKVIAPLWLNLNQQLGFDEYIDWYEQNHKTETWIDWDAARAQSDKYWGSK